MRSVILAALVALAAPAICQAERQRVDLNGAWDFRPDPQDQGEAADWRAGVAFTRTIEVPGAWQAQGVGEPAERCGTTTPGWPGTGGRWPCPPPGRARPSRCASRAPIATRPCSSTARRWASTRLQRAVRIRRDRRHSLRRRQRHRAAHRQPGRGAAGRPSRTEAAPADRHAELHRQLGRHLRTRRVRATDPASIDDVYVRPDVSRSAARSS